MGVESEDASFPQFLPYPLYSRNGVHKGFGYSVQDSLCFPRGTNSPDISTTAREQLLKTYSRIQEFRPALRQPQQAWEIMASAWFDQEETQEPDLSPIVQQAQQMRLVLDDLKVRLRKILRRSRELVQVGKAQEIDPKCMIWLAQQPGHTVAQRAGPSQRILAIARHHSYSTLENQVLHSYVLLARQVAKDWLKANRGRKNLGDRVALVDKYSKTCRGLIRLLTELDVDTAPSAEVTPNYVLSEERNYMKVWNAWQELLRRGRVEEQLWAWQAQGWEDFCSLLVATAIELSPTEFLFMPPVHWNEDALQGRQFYQEGSGQEQCVSSFFIKSKGLIIGIYICPLDLPAELHGTNARIWLHLQAMGPHETEGLWLPIWALHCFAESDLAEEAQAAGNFLQSINARMPAGKKIPCGLVMVPTNCESSSTYCSGQDENNGALVTTLSINPAHSLLKALEHLLGYIEKNVVPAL